MICLRFAVFTILSVLSNWSLTVAASPDFGPESNGLRMRWMAVSPDMDVEKPELTGQVTKYFDSKAPTFVVELKNFSDEPIALRGVRYGQNWTSRGRLNTAHYGPQLFEFSITDADGVPVPRAKRFFASDSLMIAGSGMNELGAGESLKILLRPSQFMKPLDILFPVGDYKAKLTYKGVTEAQVKEVAEHRPDTPYLKAWRGTVHSNELAFSVGGADAPQPDLNWGPENNGLRAAIEIRKPDFIEENPSEKPGVPVNTKLQVVFHVKNVSDGEITFASETSRQGDNAQITKANGEKIRAGSTWYSGWPIDVRWILKPGEVAELHVLSPAINKVAEPDNYKMRYSIRFNGRIQKDKDGNQIFPAKEDWQSVLETGEIPIVLRARTLDDDLRAKPPSFVGKVKFIDDESGEEITKGSFSFRGQIKHRYHEKRLLKEGEITIPDCTKQPSFLTVRADGYEEARFSYVEFKEGETKVLKLTSARPSSFYVFGPGKTPISGAKVRYFNQIPTKAGSGGIPMKGIEGPVWGTTDENGKVTLTTLKLRHKDFDTFGENQYYFYVEPPEGDLLGDFAGPIKAGQRAPDVVLSPAISVECEVRGTKEELDRFSAEWDQPFLQRSENEKANWIYAVSKKTQAKRTKNTLQFKLEGLRVGRLRIIADFGPRPQSHSYSYGRRDPSETDVVVDIEVKKTKRLILTSKGLAEED